MKTPGVVFDCNVFLQALANDESPAARALDFLEAGVITLFVSEPVLREGSSFALLQAYEAWPEVCIFPTRNRACVAFWSRRQDFLSQEGAL